jgi:hypothetical protein
MLHMLPPALFHHLSRMLWQSLDHFRFICIDLVAYYFRYTDANGYCTGFATRVSYNRTHIVRLLLPLAGIVVFGETWL